MLYPLQTLLAFSDVVASDPGVLLRMARTLLLCVNCPRLLLTFGQQTLVPVVVSVLDFRNIF